MLKIAASFFLVILALGFLFYRSSATTQYVINNSFEIKKIKKMNFDLCRESSDKKCVAEVLKLQELTNATEGMLVLTKLLEFYNSKTAPQRESTVIEVQQSVNDLLKQIHFKNHLLLRIKPLFSFGEKGLCAMQSVEKQNTLKVLNKLSDQCDKDRQIAFETFPADKELQYVFVRRKEILKQLTSDLEAAFPTDVVGKCAVKKKRG